MELKTLSFKPGTIIKQTITGELYEVTQIDDRYVHFRQLRGNKVMYNYIGHLGTLYIKSRTARMLYGRKKDTI